MLRCLKECKPRLPAVWAKLPAGVDGIIGSRCGMPEAAVRLPPAWPNRLPFVAGWLIVGGAS
jgi:hypothetical protein